MMYIDAPSPNFGPRPTARLDMLVLHYTGMQSGPAALDRLRDPQAQVSSHYLVEEDGRVFALVDEMQRAWHAGLSHWRGDGDVNSRSIGVEIVNAGHEFGLPDFPQAQIQAVIGLCQGILSRHAIPARNVVGHADISPTRKEDPGELFPWDRLAANGIGLWPFSGNEISSISDRQAWDGLAAFGYDLTDPTAALVAFQRHFRPRQVDGRWDEQCKGRLTALLTQEI